MAEAKEYTKGIVSFADILGFRDLLQHADPSRILEIISHFNDNPDHSAGSQLWEGMLSHSSFSDCLIKTADINHPINKQDSTGHFFHELMHMVYLQAELSANFGVFIRGAITFGDFYSQVKSTSNHTGSVVLFGPAVARAYELESMHAIYPRVIVDPHLVREFWTNDLLKNSDHSREQEWADYISKIIKMDDLGVWFVDYVIALHDSFDEFDEYLSFLRRHKQTIESTAQSWCDRELLGPDSLSNKIRWVAKYHNSCIVNLNKRYSQTRLQELTVKLPEHAVFDGLTGD